LFCLLVVLVELSVLAKWLARKTPLRKLNRGEGIVSRKPRPKSVHDFLGLLYCLIVLLCICVVSCPYVIYYPTVMVRYGLFVLKVPLNPKQTRMLTLHFFYSVHVWFLFVGQLRRTVCCEFCSPLMSYRLIVLLQCFITDLTLFLLTAYSHVFCHYHIDCWETCVCRQHLSMILYFMLFDYDLFASTCQSLSEYHFIFLRWFILTRTLIFTSRSQHFWLFCSKDSLSFLFVASDIMVIESFCLKDNTFTLQ